MLEGRSEIELARRVLKKYGLNVPYDLDLFASSILNVKYLPIPIENVDGVVMNLKSPGKEPGIIINSSIPRVRQRFTLAHELGHYFIPWHIGTIGDEFHTDFRSEYEYAEMESEANNFAAELLMPSMWIEDLIDRHDNLALVQEAVIAGAEVSAQAAAIKIFEQAASNVILVKTNEYGVIDMIKSHKGTSHRMPCVGEIITDCSFEPVKSDNLFVSRNDYYHWIEVGEYLSLKQDNDVRDWRNVLSDILDDSQMPSENRRHAVQSANGVIGAAYSACKRDSTITPERFKAFCVSRFSNKKDCYWLSRHKDFDVFLDKRIKELFRL